MRSTRCLLNKWVSFGGATLPSSTTREDERIAFQKALSYVKESGIHEPRDLPTHLQEAFRRGMALEEFIRTLSDHGLMR